MKIVERARTHTRAGTLLGGRQFSGIGLLCYQANFSALGRRSASSRLLSSAGARHITNASAVTGTAGGWSGELPRSHFRGFRPRAGIPVVALVTGFTPLPLNKRLTARRWL
jgi:hypothetical protein